MTEHCELLESVRELRGALGSVSEHREALGSIKERRGASRIIGDHIAV